MRPASHTWGTSVAWGRLEANGIEAVVRLAAHGILNRLEARGVIGVVAPARRVRVFVNLVVGRVFEPRVRSGVEDV